MIGFEEKEKETGEERETIRSGIKKGRKSRIRSPLITCILLYSLEEHLLTVRLTTGSSGSHREKRNSGDIRDSDFDPTIPIVTCVYALLLRLRPFFSPGVQLPLISFMMG